MYCVKCGSKVSEGSSFCNSCGTQIDAQQLKTSLDTKDQYSYKSSLNIWSGIYSICFIIAISFLSTNSTVTTVFSIIGIVPAVITCYNWAKYKGRHPAFALWGILAPIGFLGLALLKNKWKDDMIQPQVSQKTVGAITNPSNRNTGIDANVEPNLSIRSTSLQETDRQSVLTCVKCGSSVSINDIFCTKCGARQTQPDKSIERSEESKPEKSFDYIEQLQTLAQLRDDGILTQQEFDEKKAKILRDIA